jgi:two-component system, sensor histidine kinase and response regulator
MKHKVKLLIIEDCLEDVQIYKQLLRKSINFDCAFMHAFNAGEALEMIESQQFDCILLDHFLPGTTGIEILEMLSNQELRTPVILLTGSNDSNLDLEAMQNGAVDFIEKSDLTSKILERSIRYAIECQNHINHILDINQEKEEIFSKICAKLKNPIKTIIAYCDMYLNHSENSPSGPHIYDLIKYINQCSRVQLKSIDELIEEQFVNARKPILRFQQIDLAKLLEILKKQIKGINLTWDSHKNLMISADKLRLMSALRILFQEARKFSKKVPLEVLVDVDVEKISISLTIKNCILKESDFGELFVPYNKYKIVKGSAESCDSSNGIDLSYAKRVIELHLGRIEFKKIKEGDVCWLVYLPSLAHSLLVKEATALNHSISL